MSAAQPLRAALAGQPAPTSIAHARAIRNKYPTKFRRLFQADLADESSSAIFPLHKCSDGFTADDVAVLVAIACEQKLDGCDNEKLQYGPTHAIHALLRLGRQVVGSAESAARLADRIANMVYFDDDQGDYMTEVLQPACVQLMAEFGPLAVPSLLKEVSVFATLCPRGDHVGGILGTMNDCLIGIARDCQDTTVAQDVARGFVDALRALHASVVRCERARDGYVDKAASQFGRYLVQAIVSLAIFVRNEDTLQIGRIVYEEVMLNVEDVRELPWAEFVHSFGIECHPLDPLVYSKTHPDRELLLGMWRSRRDLGVEAMPSADGPFPGQFGYEVPRKWCIVSMCGYDQCGRRAENEAIAKYFKEEAQAGADYRKKFAEIEQDMVAHDPQYRVRRYLHSWASLKKCGGCCSISYCSPECQRSHWQGTKAPKPKFDHLPAHVAESLKSGSLLRLLMGHVNINADHKIECKMLGPVIRAMNSTSDTAIDS